MSHQLADLQRRLSEQRAAAKAYRALQKIQRGDRQDIVDLLCAATQKDAVNKVVVSTVYNMIEEFGKDVVVGWIETAGSRLNTSDETKLCKYICGIRRNVREKEEDQP